MTIHAELAHLDALLAAGPCPPPVLSSASDWSDPGWFDRWLRSHPDQLAAHRAALAAVVERAAVPSTDDIAAENARLAARQRTIDNLKEHTP